MEIPQEEIRQVIDRFEKDIEQGISSRNWLPYLAKIRNWLDATQHGVQPTTTAAVCNHGAVEGQCVEEKCSHFFGRG